MADLSTIVLPDGTICNIKDATARTSIADISLGSTYDSLTKTVTLVAGSLTDADDTEY